MSWKAPDFDTSKLTPDQKNRLRIANSGPNPRAGLSQSFINGFRREIEELAKSQPSLLRNQPAGNNSPGPAGSAFGNTPTGTPTPQSQTAAAFGNNAAQVPANPATQTPAPAAVPGAPNQLAAGLSGVVDNGMSRLQNTQNQQQAQVGQMTNAQTQDQTTAQSQAGLQSSSQTGTTLQTSQNNISSGLVDAIGATDALRGNLSQAGANDAARNQFLTSTMQQGNPAMQQQINAMAARATGGPGGALQGAGGAARSLNAGLSNLISGDVGARLNAAQQLAGPSGVATAANAAVPFMQQQQSATSSNLAQQAQRANTTSLTSGLTNALTNTAGITNMGQAAVGNAPVQQVQSGGGGLCCFIFLEALNGKLPPFVRQCRDELCTPVRRSGYIHMANWLVPRMRKSRVSLSVTNNYMIKPFLAFGNWLKKADKSKPGYHFGWLWMPVCYAWFAVWDLTGKVKGEVCFRS